MGIKFEVITYEQTDNWRCTNRGCNFVFSATYQVRYRKYIDNTESTHQKIKPCCPRCESQRVKITRSYKHKPGQTSLTAWAKDERKRREHRGDFE